MRKEQIIRTVYSKPEVEIMRIHMDCQLMEASYPGDHKKETTNRDQQKKPTALPSRVSFSAVAKTIHRALLGMIKTKRQ